MVRVEDNLGSVVIAQRHGRDPSTVSRVLKKRMARKQGRKPLLTKAAIGQLQEKLGAGLFFADTGIEVSVYCRHWG